MISNNVANIENENESTAFDRKRSSKGSKERPESRQRRRKVQNTIMNINIERPKANKSSSRSPSKSRQQN